MALDFFLNFTFHITILDEDEDDKEVWRFVSTTLFSTVSSKLVAYCNCKLKFSHILHYLFV